MVNIRYLHFGLETLTREWEIMSKPSRFIICISPSTKEKTLFTTQKAQKEIAASDWAIGIVQNPDENIAIEHLEGEVNSPYSDFAPVLLEDGLVFSSLRFDQEDIELPASLYSKVLKVNGTGVEDYDENINEQNILTAHSAFNINKSRIFYTVCDYVNIGEVQCDLYYRPVLGDGTLGNEVKLPDGINQATSTSTQPSVGFNEALGKEVLYFVSDRSGGQGQTGHLVYYSGWWWINMAPL